MGAVTKQPRSPVVLVVDDSANARDLLRDALRDAGFGVITADSGATALRIMEEQRPAVAIIDLLMPDMSGFQLRAEMLRRPSLAATPVVVTSGYWRRPSETLEAAAVLPKPLNIDQLVATLHNILSSRPAAAGQPEPAPGSPTPSAR